MNRKKLIKIASTFFVGMIVFTILARGADNMLVAQVEIGRVSSGSIDHTLKIEGTIMHNQEKALVLPAELRIQAVHVDVGERVEMGDLLLTLDIEALAIRIEELEHSITNSTDQHKLAVKRAQVDYNTAVDQGTTSVNEALRLYNEAIAKYSEAQIGTEDEGMNVDYIETCYQGMLSAKNVYDNAVAEKERMVLEAGRALEDAKNNDASQVSDIDILTKMKNIQENAGEIRAEESTQILEILGQTGDKTIDGAIMRMVDVAAGFKVQGGISIQESKRISIGTQVVVTGMDEVGSQQTLEDLVVRDILVGQGLQAEENMGGEAIIVVDIAKDGLSVGTPVTIETLDNETQYSICVPIEALYQDAEKQYFVFMMQEKKGILGDGHVAYRVDVEVVDKNNQYAALVEDIISQDMEIIMQSSKAIEDGSRVRRME